ncbi:MAG: helix-turn-helix domain-containing protein [Elusimicrobia bacterium]|nr:helix-turn-helix domain-containing protein [Elusimicrobiota bacterium]
MNTDKERLPAVMELLQGGDAEKISEKYGMAREELLNWKDRFLEGGRTAMGDDHPVIAVWKKSLRSLLLKYEGFRASHGNFLIMLFIFFLLLNIACYWLGVTTAFSELLRGDDRFYYFKVQLPVGFLGALFDTLSFFVTVYIIRRALKTKTALSYIGHLSIDLLIAVVATAWVLFVFWISGWIIGLTETEPQTLTQRTETYEHLIVEVAKNPAAGLRNIYFGIVMGFSTLIPTAIHVYMSTRSVFTYIFRESSR